MIELNGVLDRKSRWLLGTSLSGLLGLSSVVIGTSVKDTEPLNTRGWVGVSDFRDAAASAPRGSRGAGSSLDLVHGSLLAGAGPVGARLRERTPLPPGVSERRGAWELQDDGTEGKGAIVMGEEGGAAAAPKKSSLAASGGVGGGGGSGASFSASPAAAPSAAAPSSLLSSLGSSLSALSPFSRSSRGSTPADQNGNQSLAGNTGILSSARRLGANLLNRTNPGSSFQANSPVTSETSETTAGENGGALQSIQGPGASNGAANAATRPTPSNPVQPQPNGPLPGTVGDSQNSRVGPTSSTGTTGTSPTQDPRLRTPFGACVIQVSKTNLRCGALTCAEQDARNIAQDLQELFTDGRSSLHGIVGGSVLPDVRAALRDQTELELALRKRFTCRGCDLLNTCMQMGNAEVKDIVTLLTGEAEQASLAEPHLQLNRPATGSVPWRQPGFSAIDREEQAVRAIRGLKERSEGSFERCTSAIPQKIRVCERKWYVAGVAKICKDEDYREGQKVKTEFRAIVDRLSVIQDETLAALDPGWCERNHCRTRSLERVQTKMRKLLDNIEVFSDELPGGTGRDLEDAEALADEAKGLLAKPEGDRSRDYVDGVSILADAAQKADRQVQSFTQLRNAACTTR